MDKQTSQSKQEILRQGQQSDFWQIIITYLKESKEHLRQQQDSDNLKDLPADQYKVENELLKAKIQYLDKLADYPNTIIGWLQNPNPEEKDWDPYGK